MATAERSLLQCAPMLPVLTINELAHAVPLARALVAGGLPLLEVTLRTAHGLAAIREIAAGVEGAVVGAGTVLSEADLDYALAAGAGFIVTPGLTPSLLLAGEACGLPFIPGVATASDIMACLERGMDTLKFFPAEAAGGAAALRAMGGPFPGVRFCPTGGIGPANVATYLALPSVVSVGGSWVAPADLVAARDWAAITELARETVRLVASLRSNRGG